MYIDVAVQQELAEICFDHYKHDNRVSPHMVSVHMCVCAQTVKNTASCQSNEKCPHPTHQRTCITQSWSLCKNTHTINTCLHICSFFCKALLHQNSKKAETILNPLHIYQT